MAEGKMYSTTDEPESDVFIFKQSLYLPLSEVENPIPAEHACPFPAPGAEVRSLAAYIS